MDLLRTGKEGCFCKLNAILTFQEWLEDFSSDETKKIGEAIIAKEIALVKDRVPEYFSPDIVNKLMKYHSRIIKGERDLCF
jgi:2-iminoacetate synthase